LVCVVKRPGISLAAGGLARQASRLTALAKADNRTLSQYAIGAALKGR
jgi:hypothetical protein